MDVHHRRRLLKSALRQTFESKGLLETDSSVMVRCAGVERNLRFFQTRHIDHDHSHEDWYLRTSPELALKVQLAQLPEAANGLFEIGPCFRNHGERGAWHRPEFTMIEWYYRQGSIDELISESIDLLRSLSHQLSRYLHVIPIEEEVPQFTVSDLFYRLTGVYLDQAGLAQRLTRFPSIQPTDDDETVFYKILLDVMEPAMSKFPVAVLRDYPAVTSGLARVHKGMAQRFELYVRGIELCNGFQELTGEHALRTTIQAVAAFRDRQGFEPICVSDEEIRALSSLHRDYIGNAMGFERLGALLCGETSIERWSLR